MVNLKHMRKLFTLCCVILLLCGYGTAATAEKQRKLIFATGSPSGTYYPYGVALSKAVMTGNPGVVITPVGTLGSSDNIRLLKKNEAHLAIVQNDIAGYAFRGDEGFQGKHTGMRAIAALYPELLQMVVRSDGPIRSVSDLRGLTVVAGSRGNSVTTTFRQVLDSYGMKDKDVKMEPHSFAQSAWLFKQKSLDAFILVTAIPSPVVTDLASTTNISVLPLPKEKIGSIVRANPFLEPAAIPAGTYKGQDSEVPTLAVRALLVAPADLDEDLAYRITRALFENAAILADGHPAGKALSIQKALKGLSIPPHPGALRYYREKALSR